MGNLLLQETCTLDFLTGKQKKNCGEQSMFLVENTHEPTITKEVFEEAQNRKMNRTHYEKEQQYRKSKSAAYFGRKVL